MTDTRDELKAIQTGDILIYKPKPKKISASKNQKWLRFQQWIQRPWFAQTRGLENASHAAICVGHNENGYPLIVHATSKNGPHMQSMLGEDKIPAWANDKWSIVAFRLENKMKNAAEQKSDFKQEINTEKLIKEVMAEFVSDLFVKKAKEIAASQNPPVWSMWIGFQACFMRSELDPEREIKVKERTQTRVICSSLIIHIMKDVLQTLGTQLHAIMEQLFKRGLKKEDDVGIRAKVQQHIAAMKRSIFPAVHTRSFPDGLEKWLSNNRRFEKARYLGEDKEKMYDEIVQEIDNQLKRLNSTRWLVDREHKVTQWDCPEEFLYSPWSKEGKYGRVKYAFERIKMSISEKEDVSGKMSAENKTLYLLKYMLSPLKEKTNISFFPRSEATSYRVILEKAAEFGISYDDIKRFDENAIPMQNKPLESKLG